MLQYPIDATREDLAKGTPEVEAEDSYSAKDDALKEYETALQKEPNRFRSVYGAGHAAELAGIAQKARTYYQQLVKICERGERQIRPELDHAASYLGGTR